MAKMRQVVQSGDRDAIARIEARLASDAPYLEPDEIPPVLEIVERAVMTGIPFEGLEVESDDHSLAAYALAQHDQDWLITDASNYPATAMNPHLWRSWGKDARPEIRAFLRGLGEGIPLFGQGFPSVEETDCQVYAAVSLEKLRAHGPGLDELQGQVDDRLARMKDPSEEDKYTPVFLAEFRGWIDQIRDAGMDLWYCTG